MWQRLLKRADDTGAALTGAMLVTLLMAAITAGFTALVITDSRVRYLDGTRTQSFYLAHAGLEKLTADLGDLFSNNFAPTGAQINALSALSPNLGVQWLAPDGTPGYTISFPTNAQGNPDVDGHHRVVGRVPGPGRPRDAVHDDRDRAHA